jgi:hypothetical protein
MSMKNFNDTSWDCFYLYICYSVIVICISGLFLSFPSVYCHHIYRTGSCPYWHSSVGEGGEGERFFMEKVYRSSK